MRAKEGGKEPSVPFQWSLTVHHKSLAFHPRLYDAKNEAPEQGGWCGYIAGRRVIMFLTDSQNTIIHHNKEKVYMLSIKNILQQFILLIHRTFSLKVVILSRLFGLSFCTLVNLVTIYSR